MLMLALDLLQLPASALGIRGAICVVGRSEKSRALGFSSWIVGNLLWVSWGVMNGNVYVSAMFGLYFVTALVGLRNCRHT